MTDKIFAVISAILGGGWIAQILFMRYEKRKKATEAKSAEVDLEKKEDDFMSDRLSKAYETIINLQRIVDEEREKWSRIASELSDVRLELLREKEARQTAEFNLCTRLNCPDRQPPRTSQEIS
jgi:molecular chaperone GrpE (heat shock protein)